MLTSEKTIINGVSYEVTKLPYRFSKTLALRLFKTIGPAFTDALDKMPKLDLDMDLAEIKFKDIAPSISAAVNVLAEKLTEEDFDLVVDVLAEYTKIAKEPGKWLPLKNEMEFHFAGNFSELLKWLGFALKVNFLNFSNGRGMLESLADQMRAAADVSKSQKE